MKPMFNSERWWIEFFATGFYTGKSPMAPGTAGTVGALLLAWLLSTLMPRFFIGANGWFIAVGLTVAGIFIAERALRLEIFGSGIKDPQSITVDEYAGYFVAIAGHPTNWKVLLTAFVLFRLFDITKFFPGRFVERFPGGSGVVLDDFIAGLYANVVLYLVLRMT